VHERIRRLHGYAGLGALEGSARGHRNIAERLRLIGELVEPAGGTLVDIGCGNGAYTTELARRFERVVAVDVEPDRLAAFRASDPPAHVEIRLGSADRLDLPDASVDLVTAIETVEHLGAHLDGALREAHRVLVPGGALVITTPNRWFPFEQHGWVARGRRYPGWTFPFLTWVRPLHRRLGDAATFTVAELDTAVEPLGFRRVGLRRMMPPLDRHAALRRVAEPVLRLLLRLPTRHLAQTLVVAYRRS
jgi:SAM-dependent methyltransferase